MANSTAHELILDPETAMEVLYEFDQHHLVIEDLIARSNNLSNVDALNQILCEVHSIRENAAMAQLHDITSFANAIENVLFAIINQNLGASSELGEILLMSMDRLRDFHQSQLSNVEFDNLDADKITHCLAELSVAHQAQAIIEALDNVLLALTGCLGEHHPPPLIKNSTDSKPAAVECCTSKQKKDIAFFRNIAMQIDNQCDFWSNRSDNLCHWALAINREAGHPINDIQLTAAIYLHDAGMAFISHKIINKAGKLSHFETLKIQEHPILSFEIISRMLGWEDAALMIIQHHEREDGSGYPHKISAKDICDGAKLIAILDAFFAMIKPRADRPHRRSILRAISEINACAGNQFSEYWVTHFNKAIKRDMQGGLLLQVSLDD